MTSLTAPKMTYPLGVRLLPVIATIWAAISAVATLYQIAVDLFASQVPASLNVAPFWPKVNQTQKLDGISASVVGGGYDHATFLIAGLGTDARLWYAASTLAQGLAVCAVAITIALLCRRILRGDPFRPAVATAFALSGIAVLEGGVLSQVFTQIAGFRVIEETFHSSSYSFRTDAPGIHEGAVGWPSGSNQFTIDFWPVGAALGLLALSFVLRYGAQLARDRAALAKEVDGLI